MTDQKNLLLAIVISVAILFGFHFFYELPRQRALQADMERQKALTEQTINLPEPGTEAVPPSPAGTPGVEVPGATPTGLRERSQVLAEGQRIKIDTPRLHGSVNLRGGRIDDLTLANYHVTPDESSPEVVLLSPVGAPEPYFADFGFIPAAGAQGVALPTTETVWTAAQDAVLAPGKPVTLTWDNGQGLVFEREIAVDGNYMFTVTQRVRNAGGQPVALHPYSFVQRRGTPKLEGFYILHEGPLGIVNGVLNEFEYEDLREAGAPQQLQTTGGWVGFTDKYWLVSLIPDQKATVDVRVLHQRGPSDIYQIDYRAPAVTIAPGEVTESTHRLFAGAKVVDILNGYEAELGVDRFDMAVDWGWFRFLTKPFFYALDFLGSATGNFGVAILIFTVFLRLLFFPIANKQYEAFAKMKKLQPKMEELRAKYGDNREQLSMAMMKLYKEEKANPLAGCLPILLQIPVFFALYKVLYVTIEMRHAPFFGWINDLSAPDPTTLFNLFGLIPWDPPTFLHIGVWPLLMGVTMFLQQKLSPANPDPVQQKIFLFLPVIFTFMMATFPAGLVIYWTWSNLLSILQQYVIMRRMGVKVT